MNIDSNERIFYNLAPYKLIHLLAFAVMPNKNPILKHERYIPRVIQKWGIFKLGATYLNQAKPVPRASTIYLGETEVDLKMEMPSDEKHQF